MEAKGIFGVILVYASRQTAMFCTLWSLRISKGGNLLGEPESPSQGQASYGHTAIVNSNYLELISKQIINYYFSSVYVLELQSTA